MIEFNVDFFYKKKGMIDESDEPCDDETHLHGVKFIQLDEFGNEVSIEE